MPCSANELICKTAQGLPQPAETEPLLGWEVAAAARHLLGGGGEYSVPAKGQGEMQVGSRHLG